MDDHPGFSNSMDGVSPFDGLDNLSPPADNESSGSGAAAAAAAGIGIVDSSGGSSPSSAELGARSLVLAQQVALTNVEHQTRLVALRKTQAKQRCVALEAELAGLRTATEAAFRFPGHFPIDSPSGNKLTVSLCCRLPALCFLRVLLYPPPELAL